MKIEILGMGCSKCNQLADMAKNAIAEIDGDIELVKITDIKDIMKYQVMTTPALAINGKVKVSGRIPSISEIKNWIEEEKI